MKPLINLRVFRRTQEAIYLVWDVKNLHEDQRKNIKISFKDAEDPKQGWREVIHTLSPNLEGIVESGTTLPIASYMIAVEHEKNALDYKKSYVCKLVLGTESVEDYYHDIFPFKTFPDAEKDKKGNNSHLFGWYKDNKWHKLSTIKVRVGKETILALPVVVFDKDDIVEEEE